MIFIKIFIIIIYLLSLLFIKEKKPLDNNSLFRPKINYDNSLTSLACSIEKYFELKPLHKTMPYVDRILQLKRPKNVVLLLIDGLGSRTMEKILDKDSFLMKNKKMDIYSVFPPTTAASLTSIKTGLNPSEHGWLGWSAYVPPIQKIINLYKETEKGKNYKDQDFINFKKEYYYNKRTITEMINDEEKYLGFELSCYPYNVERDIDIVFQRILETLKIQSPRKYLFAYYPEPDDLLHKKSHRSGKVVEEIKKINSKIEEYSKLILENEKTVMFIVSDHGHLISKKKSILNSKICDHLKTKKVFIENRSPAFLVKKGHESEFVEEFNKEFGDDFFLLSRKEILENNIFGEYAFENKHKLFEKSFGDYMAFAKDSSNTALLGESDHGIASYHGGYSDDEIFVPLIVLSN